jgi:hypothetical protein
VIPLFTLLILAILFGIYQRYYVNSREAYLTEHGFRLLDAVGRQLDAYIDSISRTVKTAKSAREPAKHDTSKSHLGSTQASKVYLRNFLQNLEPGDLCFDDNDKDETQRCSDDEQIGTNGFSLQFGSGPGQFRRSWDDFPVNGRLRLDKGIRDRLDFGEDYFDDVLIANPRGQVLFQQAQGNRILNLVPLLAAPTRSEVTQLGGTSGSSQSPTQQPADPATSEKAVLSRFQFSNVFDVTVAGEGYKLFVEPIQLSFDSAPKESLILCGLWSNERLSSDSFALPYSSVIWFSLTLIATGCFLWPFLKINYMSRTERLRRRDVWVLVFSIFLGTTSVLLMLLKWTHTSQVQAEIDQDLDHLAERIQNNVTEEISKARRELATLSVTRRVEELAKQRWNPQKRMLSREDDDLASYPYFDFAFWLKNDGRQEVKFTADRESTPQTPFATFSFFTDANTGERLITEKCLPASTAGTPDVLWQVVCPEAYSLETTISPNTGRFYTVIAAPHKNRTASSSLTVQAIAIRPMSLVDPVLPPNFGFAVLERDGRVLFHSNVFRNLSENFIQECKDPSIVQAALFSETPQYTDLVYSGKDRRALLTKITGLAHEPLTLVVFHNVDIDRTVDLAIVLIVSVLMGLYALVILVVALIDILRCAAYPPKWVWPCPTSCGRYVFISAANGLMVLTFLALYSWRWELGLLGFTFAFVLAGIVLTYGLVAMDAVPKIAVRWRERCEPYFKLTYVTAVVSALAIATVIPTFGFFKFAHDAASEVATKHEQLSLLEVWQLREDRISSDSHGLWAPKWIKQRRDEHLDRYEAVETAPIKYSYVGRREDVRNASAKDSQGQSHQHYSFDQYLATATSAFPANQLGREMRTLPFADVSESKSHVQFSELDNERFRVVRNDDSVSASFTTWPGAGLGVRWALLALLMFLVGCWATLLTKRIFPPDDQSFAPLGRLDRVDWRKSGEVTANELVLSEPESGRLCSPLAGIADAEYVDLRVDVQRPSSKLSDEKEIAVLDHFDFDMNNRQANLWRLQLLEQLLYKECRHIVIGSCIDPVEYLSQSDHRILADDAQEAAGLLGRWQMAMSSFHSVAFKDPAQEPFDETLEQIEEVNKPKILQLAHWIKEECDHTHYLRTLGLRLLARLKSGHTPDLGQLRDEVEASTESYYAALWSTLTPSERLVLYQLGLDGWANPKNDRAIRQLRRKGIISARPVLRIMNESFRLFAIKAQDQKEIDDWEREGKESTWRTLKFSLITIVVALAVWLLYAQKDLFQSAIGYVVALGAAATAISNLLGPFGRRSGTAAKVSDAAA